MRILIVEDVEFMGQSLEALLLSQGHQVQWIVGVQSLAGGRLVGLTADKQPCEVDSSSFQVALIDGQIWGVADETTEGKKPGDLYCANLGPDVVKVLVAHGVCCAGISSELKLNNMMLENGAKVAHNKGAMFVALVNDLLTAEQIPSLDDAALASLAEFVANCSNASNKPLREKADAYLRPFMELA